MLYVLCPSVEHQYTLVNLFISVMCIPIIMCIYIISELASPDVQTQSMSVLSFLFFDGES